MLTLCLSSTFHPLSLPSNKHLLAISNPRTYQSRASQYSSQQGDSNYSNSSSFHGFKFNNPLRVAIDSKGLTMKKKRSGGIGAVCFSGPLSVRELQWVSTVCTAVLMLSRGTAIHKSFLVPLFALQAPASIISWIKGEYGIWSAFLALLVRIFFFIPGELELPFMALLLVIVAPNQALNLRGKQEGVIISLVVAAYLAFQHFSRAGSLQNAFDRGSIISTVAIICTVAISCLLLI